MNTEQREALILREIFMLDQIESRLLDMQRKTPGMRKAIDVRLARLRRLQRVWSSAARQPNSSNTGATNEQS